MKKKADVTGQQKVGKMGEVLKVKRERTVETPERDKRPAIKPPVSQ